MAARLWQMHGIVSCPCYVPPHAAPPCSHAHVPCVYRTLHSIPYTTQRCSDVSCSWLTSQHGLTSYLCKSRTCYSVQLYVRARASVKCTLERSVRAVAEIGTFRRDRHLYIILRRLDGRHHAPSSTSVGCAPCASSDATSEGVLRGH